MRRLLALTLLLLVAFAASAQEEPLVPFEFDAVQISPDGRYGIFRISTSSRYWNEDWPTPQELYVVDLESGVVRPLALQPHGLIYCMLMDYPDRHKCTKFHYGYPTILPDSSGIVWGAAWSESEPEPRLRTQLTRYSFEAARTYNDVGVLMLPWVDVAVVVPSLHPGPNNLLMNATALPTRDTTFQNFMRIYDWYEGSFITFETAADGLSESSPSRWYWVSDHQGHALLAGASRDLRWHIIDLEAQTITETAYAPIAEISGETVTYIPITDTNDSRHFPVWWIGSADPTLTPEEAVAHARELMNANAAAQVLETFKAAVVERFSQTGLSGHSGMTAIFDEFQIYDVLGVEREDTLLVPLEWRLAQPPEGESRPLDVEGPIYFPGRG